MSTCGRMCGRIFPQAHSFERPFLTPHSCQVAAGWVRQRQHSSRQAAAKLAASQLLRAALRATAQHAALLQAQCGSARSPRRRSPHLVKQRALHLPGRQPRPPASSQLRAGQDHRAGGPAGARRPESGCWRSAARRAACARARSRRAAWPRPWRPLVRRRTIQSACCRCLAPKEGRLGLGRTLDRRECKFI